MKPLLHLDIVLSVYNQENLIEKVLYGIFKNTTTSFTLIMVFDGCTDRTEVRTRNYIRKYSPKNLKNFIAAFAPNVYETRANNIGFKLATSDYMITLQDDMLILEKGWERRLTYPLRKYDDVLAVSSRSAHNIDHIDEKIGAVYTDRASRECNTLARDTFAVRDVINRGPVAFNLHHLKKMNFLNEAYAPSDLDDADLSLRAWKQYRLRVGAYWIDYASPLHWSKGRSGESTMNVSVAIAKNTLQIAHDHREYLASHVKHTENVIIPEIEIDYISTSNFFHMPLFKPFRIHKKGIIHSIRIIKKNVQAVVFKLFEIFGKKNVREIGIKKSLGI